MNEKERKELEAQLPFIIELRVGDKVILDKVECAYLGSNRFGAATAWPERNDRTYTRHPPRSQGVGGV